MAYYVISETKTLNSLEVVNKLVGNIEPIGDEMADRYRYENLKEYGKLTSELIEQLCRGTEDAKSFQGSVKRNGKLCVEILERIQRRIIQEEKS